ncbi:MAG: hypothetical protein IAE85_10530 [Anaerolinea sp.]|nr:hypothetical protein [Anaerolinea sp.]
MTEEHMQPAPLAQHLDQAVVTAEIAKALRATLFSSTLSVAPRQVNELASQLAQHFYAFYDSRDQAAAMRQGAELARAGVGSRSALAMTEAVRRSARLHANPLAELPDLAGAFCNALLEGFMEARGQMLLEVQERTHRAYLAAQQSGAG